MKLSIAQLTSVISAYVTENKVSVDSFEVTRNNTVGLLDKIGKIFTIETSYVDKLARFDGEDLSFGKTVEEWASDLILPEDFDPTGATTLAPHVSTYRPVYYSYTLGRKAIPQTIRNNDIERAVHFEEQFVSIVADKTKKMYDSETMLKYGLKRQALGLLAEMCIDAYDSNEWAASIDIGDSFLAAVAVNEIIGVEQTAGQQDYEPYVAVKPIAISTTLADALSGGYLIKYELISELAKPVDTSTGEAFVEQVKKDVEIASDFSEGHSLNGNTLGATPSEGLVLVLKQGIMPNVEVNVMAGAFHQDKVALPTEIITIPDFGDASAKVWGVLLDARGVKCHNSYRAVRENANAQGDFLNMFFHTENTCHVSRNTFVKVYKTA